MNLVFEKFESFLGVVKEITLTELDKAKELLNTEGKDIINISDIFIGDSNSFFDILPDGTLVKVNLYIATKSIDTSSFSTISAQDLYKYHIYKCSTISQMFDSGRKHRYKINNRIDGTFHYKLFDKSNRKLKEERKNQKLHICKNCLGQFLNNYPSNSDVENFNLEEFHKNNNSFFGFDTSKLEKGEDAIENVYSQIWHEISTKIKKKRNYTCKNCGWKPKNEYQNKFIHTHHLNGDKTNNKQDNLQVLCIECHSNIDRYHIQIKSQNNYKEFIKIKNNPQQEKNMFRENESIKKAIFAPNFFNNSKNDKLKSIIINAPIINGKKSSYTKLISLLDNNPKLVFDIWTYLKEHKHSFIDYNNQTLALLLINMAEENGYYSLKSSYHNSTDVVY
jgi:hypothetical protein